MVSSTRRCMFWEVATQLYTPARTEKRPVCKAAREGEHTAQAA